jgi:predicted nucleotide-binding protein (sugar kinase/HSP70/actin superfamily)
LMIKNIPNKYVKILPIQPFSCLPSWSEFLPQ